jgi:glutamate 5-kinase
MNGMNQLRKKCLEGARRIVVKVGSNVLTAENGLNLKSIRSISRQICRLIADGMEVILVSSGAMASGIRKLGLSRRPDEIPKRQAVAAVGQAGLIMAYEKAFDTHEKKVAQILLTNEDLANRQRYLNARNTLNTLLEWQIVPIINENDTVMTEEIQFGDNDMLAASITLLMDADILINLTDIDGLYNKDPRTHNDAVLVPVVSRIDKQIETIASGISGALGRGGMQSKIKAAKRLNTAGVPMIIANGVKGAMLQMLFAGKDHGTFFIPRSEKLASRKRWIGFNLRPQGTVVLDDGAVSAILRRGKSLLPSGILEVEGEFNVGAAVAFCNSAGASLGIGLANYSAADIRKIKGLKSNQIVKRLGAKPFDEVIHRDNLVITDDPER